MSTGRGGQKPEYLCENCGGRAMFGFGCLKSPGKTGAESGRWYCATLGGGPACKVTGEPVACDVKPAYEAIPATPPPQGVLL